MNKFLFSLQLIGVLMLTGIVVTKLSETEKKDCLLEKLC